VPTVRVVAETFVPPDRVLAAAHDFSERREKIFPAVSTKRLQVHDTEGTRAGPIVNWERCRYDWSQPGLVTTTVTDSNVYDPAASSWEIRATENERGGSRVEMAWIRKFKSGARGSFFGFLFGRIGERIFGKYARDVLGNLERLDSTSS
jgi:hypothetical protein